MADEYNRIPAITIDGIRNHRCRAQMKETIICYIPVTIRANTKG